jgi:uncharacterized protein YcbK (DUF882 family)
VPVGIARSKTCCISASRAGYSCGLALLVVFFGCRGLQNAVADGDTRTITMHHAHTDENITITYKRDGRYDDAALGKLNWFLRDWRRGKETRMDPQLIDLLWEVQRETGSKEPIDVVCGYRSPETNAMLRRRSRGVARFSQHMLGHAIDFYIPGVPLEELRVIGLRMQRGGVGFYPTSGSPFVHMDTGGVRMWPRMTRDQLLHVFPDGRTVYLPEDGHPLQGYALALAELRRRGQDPTQTWFDEAREKGLSKDIVLASEEGRHADPSNQSYAMSDADREEDEGEAARTTPAAAPGQATQNPLLAALEREAARRRQDTVTPAAPAVNAEGATFQLASYNEPAPSASQPGAGLTPSQIVSARGFWDSTDDSASADQAAKLRAAAARRVLAASVADATGTITPPLGALEDRVPPDLMLAYTAQSDQKATPTPLVEAQAQLPQPTAGTTIAVKRTAYQAVSTIITSRPPSANEGTHFDNPWLDAVLISPSVHRYLTVLALGVPDYRTLASLVEKPASSVMMTFGADPNPGMTDDRFSGSAVVFISIVSYRAPTDTASLQ